MQEGIGMKFMIKPRILMKDIIIGVSNMDDGLGEKSALEWYSVKLIYEFIITGEPEQGKIDEGYNTDKHYEESIMLVQANSFDQAYTIAETKAKESENEFINIYGEKVNYVFVEGIDCFRLFDEKLETGTELYSRIIHTSKDLSRNEILDQYYPETIHQKPQYYRIRHD